jgi:hypothetical protein
MEWLKPWPRCADPDGAAQAWVSVDGDAHPEAAFACRDQYLASDEVYRGIVKEPKNFIFEQGRNGWLGKWPATRARSPSAGAVPLGPEAMARIERRLQDSGMEASDYGGDPETLHD